MLGRLALVPILLLGLAGCSGEDRLSGASGSKDGGSKGGVTVVATTTQLADFATIVGGDHATVYGVLKANIDPHDYEPSPADVQQLGAADVIVKNGLDLEGWFEDTIKAAAPKGQIIEAGDGIEVRKAGDEEEHPEGDPHIWHSPANAKIMVNGIEEALSKAAPEHAGAYQRNEAEYIDQLDALDAEVRGQVARLANKKVVTNHDAFGYYLDHYGLEFVGSIIPSFDTQAELSADNISDIVANIKSSGVKAVFSESSLPPKTAEAIGKEAGVKVVAGEDALYGDTLGPEGSGGDSYLKMIRHNTKALVDNLS
ncbi:MAG: Zinc ABC transporter, substrate-binding protein ZnuA [uncultured Acidimicrobiales bacterium]|uniref:Zinc ABC transporter, substrate-binding protein ZnuA n=1 Tax=uncultured Acidimicrobiales bacterium TaxID=310071 RepID=A0A6J4HED6_9ACTN|nr:MAG: Zinc ABC transporter, substrate-binding protein ZnuA [uncultured Acidimicrobiales bacterium]